MVNMQTLQKMLIKILQEYYTENIKGALRRGLSGHPQLKLPTLLFYFIIQFMIISIIIFSFHMYAYSFISIYIYIYVNVCYTYVYCV